jgi:membrane-bound lytic murein transglycosylase B
MEVSLLRRPLLTAALAVACLIGLVPGARAETSSEADAKAKAILTQVKQLQAQVAAAEKKYDAALAGVAASVTQSVSADESSQQLAAQADAYQRQLDDRVRALYMSGGPIALYASLLDAADAADLQARVITVRRVISADRDRAVASSSVAVAADRKLAVARKAARSRIATERSVAEVYVRLDGLLQQQQALLAQANAHTAAVKAAEAALAAQRAALAAITSNRIGSLRPMPPPEEFFRLYRAAAPTCPGLSWTVLAAIGQVESGHGRDVSTSYAGAMGPMQFLPATFAVYAVDGNHDGTLDIMDPADAIFTAARYLCANGAGAGGQSLYQAIWNYNHADWYVQMVLALAQQYAGQSGGNG